MSGLKLIVGLSAVAILGHSAPAGLPLVTTFSAANIGAEATGWSMAQSADGVLHFGCNSLVSYDGERWRISSVKGAYAFRGLDYGKDERLWAAAVGDLGWFTKGGDGEWNFHSLKANLPKGAAPLGDVWHAFADGAGAVFVSTDKVLRWNGTTFSVWSMPVTGARRLHAMRVGEQIYIHHRPTGLYVMEENGPRLVLPSSELDDGNIFWMERRDDGWLFATSNGLFVSTQGKSRQFSPEVSSFLRDHSLTSVAKLADGRLALATYSAGIVVVRPDGAIDRIIDEAAGLPNRVVYFVGVDRDGGLWTSSPSSIARIDISSKSTLIDGRLGVPDSPIRKIEGAGDLTTIATDKGVYSLQTPTGSFAAIPGLGESYFDILSTEDGLLCGGSRGVVCLQAGGATLLRKSAQTVFLVRKSRTWPGKFIISEGHSILLVDSTGEARTLVHDLPDIATSIAEDDGSLWIGTAAHGILLAHPADSGFVRATPADLTRNFIGHEDSGIVLNVPDKGVVVLTNRGGWYKGFGAAEFSKIAGYPSREISAASPTADGTIWTVHSASGSVAACLGHISVQGKSAVWQPHWIQGLEQIGAPRTIFAQSSHDGSSRIWIGGEKTILRTEVALELENQKPRPPLLYALSNDADEAVSHPITKSLPYSTRSVNFEFAAPEFALRPSLRLETRIDGIDDRWMPADATSRRELTAVRDGSYAFHVRAVAPTGVASDTTSFQFQVSPPWWRTVPAMAGAFLALFPLGFGAYSVRVRTLRRRNAELEEKVGQRTEQLALASAAKTQFVANMSHDIRNPLNGIVGLALALEDTRLDPKQRELVATLRECTSYLSTLVDDVLDFASIEAGRVELRPGPFAPAELLRSVVATLRADAATRGATLSIEVDPALPQLILGDAGRIQQILVNYVSNALKYAGGRIHLSATAPKDSPGEIEFAVADEGAGINDGDQAGLFTKFHRLTKAQHSDIKGSGVGLASCRLLADLMGGSVGVASKPGHGARFHLRLPVTIAEAPEPITAPTLPNTSVLLVEDADYNAWAATAVLGKLGLTCERARTGEEAVRMFSEKRYNLVLLDRNLPDMDGTDVARKIRALEEDGPRAILLAVTAYCTAQDRALCIAAGMDAFVGKPLTPAKLRKILVAAGRRLLSAASVQVFTDPTAPVLDVSLLDYISDGTEQGLSDQIERFLASLAEGEARLTRATRSRDFKVLAEAAHFLLSQAKLVGCAALEEAAITLERAAGARDAFAFGEMEQRVHREVQAVTAAMRRSHPAGQSA